jgi:hypothetical protein
LDFFDDEDDVAPPSDQPTRESRSVPPPSDEGPGERERPRSRRAHPAGARPPRRPNRSFADDPVPGSGDGGRGGGVSRQQIRSRQLTLLGVSIVILILLFLAFRGCLNARKDRAFENYVNDLSALTAETKQLSDNFFGAFEGGAEEGDISLVNQINADRGATQGLLNRAEGLDAPGELSSAQNQISLAYQLRRDALEVIATEVPNAQGNNSKRAIRKIAEQMRVLLASDVLFARARFEIEQGLANQDLVVEEGVPDSVFLPKEPDFLEEETVADALSGAGVGSSQNCDDVDPDELRGLELSSTTAQPEGIVLQPADSGTENVVAADGTEFEVAVLNGGEAQEGDIDVTLSGDFTGSQTIDSVGPGETATVTIPPKPAPQSGDTASITVTVDTVCGEQLESNNESSYEITFG